MKVRFLAGIYRAHTGEEVEVIGLGRSPNTGAVMVIVLREDGEFLLYRPDEFEAELTTKDGKVRRFELIQIREEGHDAECD